MVATIVMPCRTRFFTFFMTSWAVKESRPEVGSAGERVGHYCSHYFGLECMGKP